MKEIANSVELISLYGTFTGYLTTTTEFGYMPDINIGNHLIVAATTTFIYVDPAGSFTIPCYIKIEIDKSDFVKEPIAYFENLASVLNLRIIELCKSQMGSIKHSFSLRPINVADLRDACFSLKYL